MSELNANTNVAEKFRSYPEDVRERLLYLRQLIIEVSSSSADIGELEETLKWGEPSYVAKGGSAIRIDWKIKDPDRYAMYFNCNTKLVDTFREVCSGVLSFEGNRAIVFHIDEEVPGNALRRCIALALQYDRLKHLPLLGA